MKHHLFHYHLAQMLGNMYVAFLKVLDKVCSNVGPSVQWGGRVVLGELPVPGRPVGLYKSLIILLFENQ